MLSQLSIRVTAMRQLIFFFRRHLRESLVRTTRLKPWVPAEVLITPRLHENFADALSAKKMAG